MGFFKFPENVQKSNKTVVISYISKGNAEVDSCIRGSIQKHRVLPFTDLHRIGSEYAKDKINK